jgi:hypothetical protein
MSRLGAIALTASVLAVGGLGAPAPADASAFGCQYIGGFGFQFKGLSLKAPKGFLCHRISGDGRRIRSESAHYGPAPSLYGALTGRVCNWRIDFVYRRAANGNVYRRDRGRTHHRCGYLIARRVGRNKRLRYFGTACAQLYVNGKYRRRQCHSITR